MSPSSRLSALSLLETTTYSDSDSPSLAPGVGGSAPGIGAENPSCARPSLVCGRPVFGREFLNSFASGLVGLVVACSPSLNVSPSGALDRGLDLPVDALPGGLAPPAIFNLSSVALSRASRASSSEVWDETAFFLSKV